MIHEMWSLICIFFGGIALNLTPCVYPIIPITISYFGAKSENIKERPYVHALLYILGIALTNSFLGLIAALTGGMLGSILQNSIVRASISVFLFILALSLFGLWEIKIPYKISRIISKQLTGYKGTFFIGLFFGIFAAPCVGPFIIGLMAYVANKADPIMGFLYFFSLSLGMGLPIGILATFSGMINKLPSAGEWMVWVKKLFAWILVFMAVYFLRPIIGEYIEKWLFAVAVAASGIHLGLLDKTPGRRLHFIKKTIGIVLIGFSIYMPFTFHYSKIQWIPYSDSVINEAQKVDKPIILDFYADWCITCRYIDKKIFNDPEVLKKIEEFVMIRVDLTNERPYQRELLKRFNIKGLPAIVFINKEKFLKIEGKITKQDFIKKIREIRVTYN